MRFIVRIPLAAAAGAFLAACNSADLASPREQQLRANVVVNVTPLTPGNGVVGVEEFEVCKYGSSASFSYSVFNRNTGLTSAGTFGLSAGECIVVAQLGGLGADVTVTETGAQAGFQLDHVVVWNREGPNATTTTVSGPTVSGFISGSAGNTIPLHGVLAEFFNVPTPPPGGGEGCTPGYWKQAHHFDSWPAPYTPGTLFSDVFENAFPGRTLVQVLGQGGGGLNALGRHTVAALLNGGSTGVSFDLSAQQVINGFNAVFPEGDYEGQKNIFASFNEQGCPLN